MVKMKKQNYRHLSAFILLMLTETSMHGGAIHTAMMSRMPNFRSDTGAIYRALQELESSGQVNSVWDTSESGPARKIYTLTSLGWDELETWKKDIEMRVSNLTYFLDSYEKAQKNRG